MAGVWRRIIGIGLCIAIFVGVSGCGTEDLAVSPLTSPLPLPTSVPQPTSYPSPALSPSVTPPQWPAGRILYHAGQVEAGEPYRIYLVADGSSPVSLTSEGSAFEPAWSPDGKQIAFSAWIDDPASIKTYIMGSDGRGPRPLTESQPRLNWRPSWSPNGEQLTFISNRDGNFEIYRVNVDGSGLVILKGHPKNDRDAVWAPGGSRIAFVSDREGQNDIYLMNPDGSDVVRLTSEQSSDVFPRWSPTGDLLVFSSDRGGGGYGIYLLDVESKEVKLVIDQEAIDDSTPAWVGDDRVIFSVSFDTQWDLFIVNVDGTNLTQLTNTEDSERFPIWRP